MNVKTLSIALWVIVFLASLPGQIGQLFVASASQVDATLLAVTLFVAALLVGRRWDRNLQPPTSMVAISLVVVGVVAGFSSLLVDAYWLASWPFFLVCVAFLVTHRDKEARTKLIASWPPFAFAVALPGVMRFSLFELGQSTTRSMVDGLLTFLDIPHLYLGPLVESAHDAMALEAAWSSPISWELCLAATLLYCGWCRRSVLAVALNVLLSGLLVAVLHSGAITTKFCLVEWYGFSSQDYSMWVGCQAAWLAFVAFIFVSIERLAQGLAAPISVRFMTTQANPLVTIWNRVVSSRRSSQEMRSVSRVQWVAAGIVAVLLCFTGTIQAAKIPAMSEGTKQPLVTLSDEGRTQALVNVLGQELVRQDFDPISLMDLRCARSVWIGKDAFSPTEITVFAGVVSHEKARAFAAGGGWQVDIEGIGREEKFNSTEDSLRIVYMTSDFQAGTLAVLCADVDSNRQIVSNSGTAVRTVQMARQLLTADGTIDESALVSDLESATRAIFKR